MIKYDRITMQIQPTQKRGADLSRSALNMPIFLALAIFIIYPSCAWPESAVFGYDDFGPQVLAYETIGYQWYQWNSSDDNDPKKTGDIKVVVYWNESMVGLAGEKLENLH